jgi:adenine-specific DNA-methyltransferase
MDFLDPFFRALGWDIENKAGLIPQHREVEIESRTQVGSRQKRADYLFRTDRQDRFVCEAKKPAEILHAGHAFQAKRYAWNKGLVLAMLSDFEEFKVYVVGSKPHPDEVDVGLWKTWPFQQYPAVAQEIWDLLARPSVATGSIDKLVEQLPRKATVKGKARAQWLFRPDRTRALDTDFLNFLDEARRELASDLIRHNDRADLLQGTRLNEAVQRILDRLLFLRICEDRDIDTGRPLALILKAWRDTSGNAPPRRVRQSELLLHDAETGQASEAASAPPSSLWREVVAHFRALDRRPPSFIPFFNGNLFKPHFSEELEVSDEWIAGFIDDVGDDESPYLFNVIPVEILGTIYERFLGKVVRPKGRGVTIEEKPEVRKAGGVYYTPRYIVDYIVEQTVGKLLEDKPPRESLKLHILDPACGSGSFLIRAFERVCEHWQTAMMKDENMRRKQDCWTDPDTGDIHLTSSLKRRILTANIYGVDIDPGAVEVTQLSLYLKMLEGENRTTLARERDLFGSDVALLPPLESNIKCGNSLIASDYSMDPEELLSVKAFDWPVQFAEIMKAGGFDAVIGNPPYRRELDYKELLDQIAQGSFGSKYRKPRMDLWYYFVHRGIELLRLRGLLSFIVNSYWTSGTGAEKLIDTLRKNAHLQEIFFFGKLKVFQEVSGQHMILLVCNCCSPEPTLIKITKPTTEISAEPFVNGTAPVEIFQKNEVQLYSHGKVDLEMSADDIMKKIECGVPLCSLGKVRQGIAENPASINRKTNEAYGSRWKIGQGVFALRQDELRQIGLSKEELSLLRPYHDLLDVDRYWLSAAPSLSLIYSTRETCPDICRYPGVCAHLKQFRPIMDKRRETLSKANSWWHIHWPRDEQLWRSPKLIVVQMARRPTIAVARQPAYVPFSINVFVPDAITAEHLNYFAGLLNSRLIWLWFSHYAKRRGVGLEINGNVLQRAPIRRIDFSKPEDKSAHDKIVLLVDKMEALVRRLRTSKTDSERATMQNAVTATDQQIDAMVYELYGLTKEEVELVEKN